jgi:hypothetical protein
LLIWGWLVGGCRICERGLGFGMIYCRDFTLIGIVTTFAFGYAGNRANDECNSEKRTGCDPVLFGFAVLTND